MKTKFGLPIILFFLIACGSKDRRNEIIFSPEPEAVITKSDKVNVITDKFRIKASNNMYLSVLSDTSIVANQPDPNKAEVFIKVELGNGKIGLKTLGGKFISDNRNNNSKIDAIRDQAQSWEQFELVFNDQNSVYIKSSQGKYICADQSLQSVLYANRDKPGEWEAFVLEPLNQKK